MRILTYLVAALLVGALARAQPEPLSRPGMAIDTESALLVVFGGTLESGSPFGETWVFDLVSREWEKRNPSLSPPAIHEHVMAYDAQSDLIVVWGGSMSEGGNRDLWAYDANDDAWTRIEQDPAAIPPGRILAEAAYHPGIDRIVVVCIQPGPLTPQYPAGEQVGLDAVAQRLPCPRQRAAHGRSPGAVVVRGGSHQTAGSGA